MTIEAVLTEVTMTDSGSAPQEEEQGRKGQSGSPVEEVKSCDASKENATKMETTEEIANKLKTTKEEAHKGVDKMQEEMTGTSMTKELETFNETNCNDSEEMDMNRCRGDTKDDINNGHKEGFTIPPDQTLRERRVANENKKTTMVNGLDEVDATEALDREQKSVKDVAPGKKNSQGVQLLTFFEAPPHLRFNQYVLGSYRPPMDIHGCLASLTYFHNETINILTHAVPVLLIAAAVPWMLPWDEISVPWLPAIHVVACMAPWVGSTFYHLFMCHRLGKIAYTALLKLDLLGIWFTQTFGALVTISAATHCFQYETKCWLLIFYSMLCFLCLYQAMTVSTVWGRRFAFSAPFLIRICCLALRLSSFGGGAPNTTLAVILQDLLAIIGGYIGAVNIPEKWFPGKCDLLCNSHNIMHVLVVMAVYQMHQAASLDLVWMSDSSSCSGVPSLL